MKILNRYLKNSRCTLLLITTCLFSCLFSCQKEEVKNKSTYVCDKECGSGRMCMAGGCMFVLSKEYRHAWHEDLRKWHDSRSIWKPSAAFGEKLQNTPNCNPQKASVKITNEKAKALLFYSTIYELNKNKIFVYKHLRSKSDMWTDSARFFLNGIKPPLPNSICTSKNISHFSTTQAGKNKKHLNVFLKHAVPVGGVAVADISFVIKPSSAGNGISTLTIPLLKNTGKTTEMKTVITIPLGSDFISLAGPPPKRQRLLSEFVAYYWENTDYFGQISIKYSIPPNASSRRLVLNEVKP